MASLKSSSDLVTLLLEDDENLNHLYYGVFQRVGYRVSQAHTVAQALEVLQQRYVLLVVTDWCLPDGIGAPVNKLARQQNSPMPVLLISG